MFFRSSNATGVVVTSHVEASENAVSIAILSLPGVPFTRSIDGAIDQSTTHRLRSLTEGDRVTGLPVGTVPTAIG